MQLPCNCLSLVGGVTGLLHQGNSCERGGGVPVRALLVVGLLDVVGWGLTWGSSVAVWKWGPIGERWTAHPRE